MSIEIYDRCFRAIRSLRFNWVQNPVVTLDEKLQTVGLSSDHLKNGPKSFEVFRRQLYRRLSKRYHGLLDFIVPAHFIGQIEVMRYMLKHKPRNEQMYEQIKRAITTPQFRKGPNLEKFSTKLIVD